MSISETDDAAAVEKKGVENLPVPTDQRKVYWGYTHHVFLSGATIKKLKEKAQRKEAFELDVRTLLLGEKYQYLSNVISSPAQYIPNSVRPMIPRQ